MEKFSEMKYVRPDGEAYIQTIQKETKNFNEAADFEGAHQAFVAILNANSHFNTTRVMASIRNSQDTNDEFYRKEMEYIFEIERVDVDGIKRGVFLDLLRLNGEVVLENLPDGVNGSHGSPFVMGSITKRHVSGNGG